MPATRPYFLVFKGETFIIEATNSALAVQHVVGADVTELRPARAAEVTAWSRAGKPIPMAGEKPAAIVSELKADPAPIDTTDVAAWIADQLADGPAAATGPVSGAWSRVVSTKRMTLEDFDIIRTAAPAFAEAMAYASKGDAPVDVEQIRASIEENPMDLDEVVEAVQMAMRADEALIVDRDGPR